MWRRIVDSVLIACVALLAGCGRRPAAPAAVPVASGGRPVIFVGLDGADWQLLDAYIAKGTLPNLAALVREGVSGTLLTEEPPLSPIVWTTMMTGVSPLEHGVLDFARFNPETHLKEPITSAERARPAVWNMASAAGKTVAVFGLWATHPAEPVNGLLVSDRLFSFQYAEARIPPGTVFPREREPAARAAVADAWRDVDRAALAHYVPALTDAEYDAARRAPDPFREPVAALARIVVETEVYDHLARTLIAETRPDLAIVYLQGTDTIGHVFAPFVPPRQQGISEADVQRYGGVPERYFATIDRLLGAYRDLARARGAVLMIASDHGFHWGEGRPARLASAAAATAGKWHRDRGIYVLWGEGIAPRGAAHEGTGGVRQVAATLLALLGLPAGEGLAAPPLPGAPASTASFDYSRLPIPRAAPADDAAEADAEQLAKLKSLGYIGAQESAAAPAGERGTKTAGAWNNTGLILRGMGRTDDARAAFEKALALDPNLPSAMWNLSELLFAGGSDLDRADTLLVAALARELPDGAAAVIGRSIKYRRSGQLPRSAALLDAAVNARPDAPGLRLFRGRYRLEQQACDGARADFEAATRAAPDDPLAAASLGVACACLGDRSGARAAFTRSLALAPDQPEVRRMLRSLD